MRRTFGRLYFDTQKCVVKMHKKYFPVLWRMTERARKNFFEKIFTLIRPVLYIMPKIARGLLRKIVARIAKRGLTNGFFYYIIVAT